MVMAHSKKLINIYILIPQKIAMVKEL